MQLDTGLVFLLDGDQDQLASVYSEQRLEVTWPLPLNSTDTELLDAAAGSLGSTSGSLHSTAAGLNATEHEPFNATAAGVSCSTAFLSGNATLLNSTAQDQELDLPLSSEVAICPLASDTDSEAKVEGGSAHLTRLPLRLTFIGRSRQGKRSVQGFTVFCAAATCLRR